MNLTRQNNIGPRFLSDVNVGWWDGGDIMREDRGRSRSSLLSVLPGGGCGSQ